MFLPDTVEEALDRCWVVLQLLFYKHSRLVYKTQSLISPKKMNSDKIMRTEIEQIPNRNTTCTP